MTSRASSPAALVLLTLGLLGVLLGIPARLSPQAPGGARTGLVVDARGYGAAHTPIYHFDAEGELVERTLTDEDGRFALQVPTTRAHILARPEVDRGLAPRWILDDPLGSGRLEFVLASATPLEIRVLDRWNDPVPGAEVRAYERGRQTTVLAIGTTDARGRASLVIPPRADVAVRVPGDPVRWLWRLDVASGDGPRHLDFATEEGQVVGGVVTGSSGPAEGLWVMAGDPDDPEDFAFALSAADGSFELAVAETAGTEVLVVDPRDRYLPRRLVLTGPEALEMALDHGEPLEVSYGAPAHAPGAWIWVWEPGEQVWSWGRPTGRDGKASLRVGRRFGLHARPVHPRYEGLTLWDLEYRSPFLRLDASSPGRP
jgi:hypothetical protein